MSQWEFLLQQEGKEDWQPLGAQVTTGKYRLLCRSPWQDQEVPITITYTAADTGKQRQQRRSPRLNSQGLMVIMPFTSLLPGIWQWQVFHPETPNTPVTTVCLQVTAPVSESAPSIAKETSPELAAPQQLEIPIPSQTPKPFQKPISTSATETGISQPSSNPEKNLEQNPNKNLDKPAPIPPHRPLISIDALREQSLAEIDSVLQEAIDGVWDLVQTPTQPNTFFSPDEDYILLDYDPLDDEVAYLSELNSDLEIGTGNYQGNYLENYPENYHEGYPAIPQLIPQSIGDFALNNQTANAPVISFRLDRDHFMAQQGEYLTITGRVEIALGALLSGEELPAELRNTFLQGSVHYQLRDPDSSSILINTDYPLQVKVPLGEFSHTLKIPFKTDSHLLLGEATLYGKEQQVLGSKSFIVSANLDRLLQTVQDTPEDLPQTVAAPSKRQNYPVLPYQPKLDVDSKARKAFPKPLNSSYNAKGRIKSLHLPDFSGKTAPNLEDNLPPLVNSKQNPNQKPNQILNQPSEQSSGLDNVGATTANFGEGSQFNNQINTPHGESIEAPETLENLPTSETPDIIEALTIPTAPESLETPEAGLSEGNFLSRLNTLAIDKQMTEILHTELLLDQAAPGASDRQLLPPASDADWRVLEVVVDDEPPEPEPEPRFDASGFPYPQKLTTPIPAAQTPDQTPRPVPTPEIIAPAGELLIGESVTVTVKLPAQQFSLYAKFWVKDCQTTAIIDGPRLLLDFSPNGQGEMETLTRLTVPPGCCRVRLEAIAIDPLQEKESRKVSIDRVVVPPDTPDLSATGLSYLAG